ncbi:coiled-coil domain-containing protein 154 isoform X3 [Lemur catta]|uniref:coiled-coil domain-containing protein 154 isoform X3 n=1 Tax=Lemur catta TaxID=9447 RepID=UPI001E26AFA6|nr:coiled-coil domain-containing protein 154 isoform X3 [Lemur catta]
MLPTPRPARPPPPSSQHPPALGCCGLRTTSRATAAGEVMSEPADSGPSSGASPPSQVSTVTSEDLGLLAGSLASPEPWSLETSERDASGHLASTASVPEQDSAKHWKQLEQWVSSLQAEVACLRGQEERREHATLGLLRELLQVRALVRVQDAELQRLQQEVQRAAPAPEKETPEPPGPQSQNQMQALDQRLVEVREALRQVRRQTLQDSERKDAEQEMALRWALGTALGRHLVVIGTASRTSPALAELLAAGTPVGKVTPAWPCPFPSSSPSACARAGPCASRLASREVVPGPRGIKVQWPPSLPVAPQPGPATRSQCPQGGQADRLAEAGGAEPGGSLQRPAEGPGGRQPAGGPRGGQDAGPGDHARRGDEPSLPEEGGQAVRLPSEELPGPGEEDEGGGELAAAAGGPPAGGAGGPLGGAAGADGGAAAGPVRAVQGGARPAGGRPPPGAVPGPGRGCGPADQVRAAEPGVAEPRPAGRAEGSLREKSQVLEASVAQLAAQLKDLSDQFLTLSCRLDLQGQVLGLRLSEAKTEWEGAERKSLEDLARWQKEVAVQLQGLWEKVDGLPRQIEGVSDKCVLHKSDSDIRISAEGRARESEVGALRRELAALLSAVQLLKEDNPGRKIAEMQGRMATFQNQIIKLENSIQANRTIQNLQFNTETKLRAQKMAALRDSARLWGEEGPWARALGSRKAHTSPGRQRFFVKDVAPGEVPVNRWGVYQATRWDGAHTAPAGLPGWASGWSPRGWGLGRGQGPESRPWQVAAVEGDAPEPGGPVEAGRGPAAAPQRSLRGASRLCSSHRNKRALTCRAGP